MKSKTSNSRFKNSSLNVGKILLEFKNSGWMWARLSYNSRAPTSNATMESSVQNLPGCGFSPHYCSHCWPAVPLALNDRYMKQADIKFQAALLKDNEFGHRKSYLVELCSDFLRWWKVPYFISLWAIHKNHKSATRFLNDVGHTQWARYADKAKD